MFLSSRTSDFYDLYSRCRLVVGFRLHATIICLALGVPFVPIFFDRRGEGFAETYNSARWMIDGSRFGLLKTLTARTAAILADDPAPFAEFIDRRALLRRHMTQFLADSLGKADLGMSCGGRSL